jgi:hypothetical protein
MPALKVSTCSDASEFLTILRRSNARWWNDGDGHSPWVFRGVGNAESWKLLPSAWRHVGNKLEPMRQIVAAKKLDIGCDEGENGIHRTYREWHAAEQEALFQFATLANEVGFRVNPKTYSKERSPIAQGRIHLIRGEDLWPDIELRLC